MGPGPRLALVTGLRDLEFCRLQPLTGQDGISSSLRSWEDPWFARQGWACEVGLMRERWRHVFVGMAATNA